MQANLRTGPVQADLARPFEQASASKRREQYGLWSIMGIIYLLLASFEYSNTTVAPHMVQILVILCVEIAPAMCDSDDAAHILCGPRVKQPQAEHRIRLVCQAQSQPGMILL